MSRTAAILLAAGSGRRMGGAVPDKVLAPSPASRPSRTPPPPSCSSAVADLYVVTYRDQRQMMELSAYAPTPTILVRGGASARTRS
jgi:2-C-methyl-D-erythritol 4-phosphate cytidylyltransferase